jgi:hypothetical protein
MKLVAGANTIGLMVNFMKGNGKRIKCTAMVSYFGRIIKNMRENLSMTKEKEKELSHGQMADNILVSGKEESNMEKELISLKMASEKMENGIMVEKYSG